MLPPTKDEVKDWKTFYLVYFNSEKSVSQGRRLPQKLCVKNPRPDEVSDALGKLGFKSICDHERKHPSDLFHPGRIKF